MIRTSQWVLLALLSRINLLESKSKAGNGIFRCSASSPKHALSGFAVTWLPRAPTYFSIIKDRQSLTKWGSYWIPWYWTALIGNFGLSLGKWYSKFLYSGTGSICPRNGLFQNLWHSFLFFPLSVLHKCTCTKWSTMVGTMPAVPWCLSLPSILLPVKGNLLAAIKFSLPNFDTPGEIANVQSEVLQSLPSFWLPKALGADFT